MAPLEVRHAVKYFILGSVFLGAFLLYLLSTATANTALFARNYPLLLGLNGALVTLLLGLVIYQLRLLLKRLRAGAFGSRLTLRMVMLFSLTAVLPGVLVYGVSVQFLVKSIESWFDVRVDKAMEGGLNLGRTAMDNLLRDLAKKAGVMGVDLGDASATETPKVLAKLREQAGVQQATLFDLKGRVIAYATEESARISIEVPSGQVLRGIRQQQGSSSLLTLRDQGLTLVAYAPVNRWRSSQETFALQLVHRVPRQLAADADTVQDIYREYQELSYARQGLKRIYAVTLTLTLLLALLSAILMGFVFSERLAAPLGILARGTQAVAKGDYSQRHPVSSNDELGILTASFNTMTQQLADASAAVERKQQELEQANIDLESILANLSAGVLVFDEGLGLRRENPSASRILAMPVASLRGVTLTDWAERVATLKTFADGVLEGFRRAPNDAWQQQLDHIGETGTQVLLVRGTHLHSDVGRGYVVVFDDVTRLLQAERDAAWGEVARRLAHEIKNPLTPIQLSAERLAHKLSSKLAGTDADMLQRSTQTIVNQVDALKNMVNAFSQYAKAPQITAQPLDLNQLVGEVLGLYESAPFKLELKLEAGLPQIQGDPTLLRQVIHNLLQNAQDALGDTEQPLVVLQTERYGPQVRLRITDNGSGFPEHILKRAFEPYVTSKSKGTGLGLAIVKKIIEEHGGSISVQNLESKGARVSFILPAAST